MRVAGVLVLGGVTTLLAAGLAMRGMWSGDPDDYYVPWSAPHSIALLLGAGVGLGCVVQMAWMERGKRRG